MKRLALAAAAVVLLSGCVYYNGIYNARRLAGSAEKAEREQRTLEANSLWGQVVTKTDTVLARHPRSKWANDARLLRGVALGRLNQCDKALPMLEQGLAGKIETDLMEKGSLALGRCRLELGDPTGAEAAFARVVESGDENRRAEARRRQGRALRAAGRYEEALAALQGVPGPEAAGDRAVALAGLGRADEAVTVADSLIARGDSTAPWPAMTAALGSRDPAAASRLVDRLRAMPGVRPETQAAWLVDDAKRLSPVDGARAEQRLAEAAAAAPGSEPSGEAQLILLRRALAGAAVPADLEQPAAGLAALAATPAPAAPAAASLAAAATHVRLVSDSIVPGAPQGDLYVFLAAEVARDSLGAPRLAAGLLRRVVDEWSESPYAPKALLAWQQLEPDDSLRALLTSRYAESPYLARALGDDPPGLRVLEDSLEGFVLVQARTLQAWEGKQPAAAPDAGARRAPGAKARPPSDEPRRGGQRPRGGKRPEL